MWILATLTDVEALEFFTQLLPLTVRLDDDPSADRLFVLSAPTEVALTEGRGLRMACPGKVHWSLPMGALDMNIITVRMMLVPSIEQRGEHSLLRFVVEVEALEIEWVPALLDQKIAELITKKLCAMPFEWNLSKTLSHRFGLPAALVPRRDVGTSVREPSCTVTSTAMTLAFFVALLPSTPEAPAFPA